MALENFTTYDEIDEDGDITIIANKITVDTMRNDAVSHVTDDKGANHFGDFEQLIDIEPVLFDPRAIMGFWGISDNYFGLYPMIDATEGLIGYISTNASDIMRGTIRDQTNGNGDYTEAVSEGNRYYTTIKRVGTTTTCKIYSDSNRSNLIDTLTITSTNATYKRILTCTSSRSPSYPTPEATANIYNLDLQEAPPPPSGGSMQPMKCWGGV